MSKNKGGRPPIYDNPEDMQKKIDEYFKKGFRTATRRTVFKGQVTEYEVPRVTITGLVLYLGFADRHSFYDYEKRPQFSHTIKRARTFIEQEYEELLDQNPSGAIFALKNFGWSDKQEVEHSGDMKLQSIIVGDLKDGGDSED